MIEDLRTAIGEQGVIGCLGTIALGLLLLPFYLGCYVWQLVMERVMVAFDDMLEDDLHRSSQH